MKKDSREAEHLQRAEGDLEAALQALREKRGLSGDERKALEKAAGQGDVRALMNLAFMYEKGLGVPKDERKVFELFQQAAEQGDDLAQFIVANWPTPIKRQEPKARKS